jgi:hypothetical protein
VNNIVRILDICRNLYVGVVLQIGAAGDQFIAGPRQSGQNDGNRFSIARKSVFGIGLPKR